MLAAIAVATLTTTAAVLAAPAPAMAAAVQVQGSIRDENGELVPDSPVNISIVGGDGYQVFTDSQGRFSFVAQTGSEVDVLVNAFEGSYNYEQMDRFTVRQNTTAHYIRGFRVSLPPTLIGTDGDDNLTGTAGRDVILGLGGNDTITGLDAADVIIAGAGNDDVQGSGGDDRISGGAGDDILNGNGGQDLIRGWDGADLIDGDAGHDDLGDDDNGQDTNTVIGGPGDDTIFVGYPALPGSQSILQILRGGDGNDRFFVPPQARVNAGPGDDVLNVTYKAGGPSRINCGDGIDAAYPNNTGVPDSVFVDCETVQVVA
ncbi:calcium-binding protein [Dactylosporangium aurantiacum]|uniref:Calcium-binding protein n=1 Tax=Dactylosporangium aurantiacum TaxID=35754 RepID=A0A9Q9IMC8_9ACTN|nr:calcium-binding protein [Dactylosporangium aurantiacum]MDG6106187.1 calcium-binding protein [Dactylosporangium aurantiacum]UWZ58311.1 calcium-binding protein [Dactylosporangium aurantiacum]